MSGKNGFFDMDISKAMQGFSIPGFDVEAFVATQRKNLEALTQANQLAMEGLQAIAHRQVELARQAVEEVTSIARDIQAPGSAKVEDQMAKHADLAKQAFEKGLANMRELTTLATKSNTEAFEVLNKRLTESMEEVRDFAKKKTAA